uniref:Uncharacterized protein n=1 Tax=viral metagenome TaxID=1070528 RepID=A0A6C0LHP8_9ZZZZ
MDTQRRKELADTPMDIQRRKELVKEKRIERLIRKEEYQEAMNKLPINERAIIKEVLIKIKSDNHKMFLAALERERNESIQGRARLREKENEEEERRRERSLMANVCIMCAGAVGTVAYVGLTLMK